MRFSSSPRPHFFFLGLALAVPLLMAANENGCAVPVVIGDGAGRSDGTGGSGCEALPCPSDATFDPVHCACVIEDAGTTDCAPLPCPSGAPWNQAECACVTCEPVSCTGDDMWVQAECACLPVKVCAPLCAPPAYVDPTTCLCVVPDGGAGDTDAGVVCDPILCVGGTVWDAAQCACVEVDAGLDGGF